jgi:hypothetical protein
MPAKFFSPNFCASNGFLALAVYGTFKISDRFPLEVFSPSCESGD